jgi:ABC-type polysaccharide/polyol phosphate export permease
MENPRAKGTLGTSLEWLLKHWPLLKYLVISNLKLAHRNLALGYLWWILNPLLWMLVYWLLVVGIFNRGEPNYPLFLLSAILPWRAFVTSVGQSMTCISGQERLIKQVSFPKAVLPLSVVLSNGVSLSFGLVILILAAILYGLPLTGYLLLLPIIALIQLSFTAGLAFMLSVFAVYFADIRNLMQFVLRIWLYLSPSLYSIERVPLRFRDVFMLNPFAPIFTSYRDVIMYGQPPEWRWLAVATVISLATLIIGFAFFIRHEQRLSKVI